MFFVPFTLLLASLALEILFLEISLYVLGVLDVTLLVGLHKGYLFLDNVLFLPQDLYPITFPFESIRLSEDVLLPKTSSQRRIRGF